MNYDFYLKKHISEIVSDINLKIKSSHIASFSFISSESVLITFSFYRKQDLYINLKNNQPYIGFVNKRKSISNLNKDIPYKFRHFIKDSYIAGVSNLNDDTIIIFDLNKKVDEFDYKKYKLIMELIHNKTNLVLCDENNNIIVVLKPHSSLLDRNMIIGQKYDLPNKVNIANKQKEDITYDDYLRYGEGLYTASLAKRKDEKYHDLLKFIKQKINITKNKLPKLDTEILNGNNDLIYKELGEACYYYQQEDLKQLFKDNNKKYDDTLTNIELANNCFYKYKKAKSKIENAATQKEKCKDDLLYYQHLLEQYENGSEDDLLQMQTYLLKNKVINKHEKQISNKLSPYFIKLDNYKILFGKNDLQNDNLTFKIAKDNDLFLHIHPYSGAHVIIKGDNPSDEVISIAAQICLLCSKKEASEVVYTNKKYLKKGHKLGQVILKKYQTLKIDKVSDKVKQLYDSAQRY